MTKVCLILVLTLLPSVLSLENISQCFACKRSIMSEFFAAIRDYGDNCTHSDECYDHRMVCVPDEYNVSRCFCDRFHKWNGSSVGCMQMYTAEEIMNKTVKVHDNVGRMDKMQEIIFKGPLYSIFFMIFMIATCTLSVVIYCLYIRKKDHNLRVILNQLLAENSTRERTWLNRQRSALESQRFPIESQQSTSRC